MKMLLKILPFLLFLPLAAQAQQIVPTGTFAPGHTVRCQNSTCTVASDAGGAAGSSLIGQNYLTEVGITNGGTPLCVNDALTSGPYHQLCFGANALGGALISYNPYKGASALGFNFNINGATYAFPGPGNGNIIGPSPTVVGDIPLWNSAAGTALSDSGVKLINVKVCGATGNGSTDDSTAINNCITQITSTGGILSFPAGTYEVCSTIVVPSKVILQGAGRGATTIQACSTGSNDVVQTTNFGGLTGTNSPTGPFEFGFRDISVDGNKAGRTGGNCVSIYGYDYLIENVEIFNCHSVGLYTEWSTSTTVPVVASGGSMEAHVSNLKVFQNGADGIDWYGPHDSRVVDTVTFLNTAFGIKIDNSAVHSGGGTMFTNFHSYGNTSTGISNNANIYVEGFESESNGGKGIDCTGTTFGFLQGSVISVYNNADQGLNLHLGCPGTLSSVQAFSNRSTGVQISNGSTIGELFTYSNTGDGVAIGIGDVNLPGLRSENNSGTGINITAAVGDVVINGKSSGNSNQINFGPGLNNTSVVNLVDLNTAGGQTSYSGTYSASAFIAVMTGGSGALSSLFVHP